MIRVHRVLAPVYRQLTILASLGCDEARMRLMTPTLDTGAGPSINRLDALPKGWERWLHRRHICPTLWTQMKTLSPPEA